jgi:hypothetical protein
LLLGIFNGLKIMIMLLHLVFLVKASPLRVKGLVDFMYHQLVCLAGVAPAYSWFIPSVKSFVLSVGKITFMHCLHILIHYISVQQGVLFPFDWLNILLPALAVRFGLRFGIAVAAISSVQYCSTALDLVVVAGSTISA